MMDANNHFQFMLNESACRLSELGSTWKGGPRALNWVTRILLADMISLLECANQADAKILNELLTRIFEEQGVEPLHQVADALSRDHFSETIERLLGLCETFSNLEDPIGELRKATGRLRGEMGEALRLAIGEFDAASDPASRIECAERAWSLYLGA